MKNRQEILLDAVNGMNKCFESNRECLLAIADRVKTNEAASSLEIATMLFALNSKIDALSHLVMGIAAHISIDE